MMARYRAGDPDPYPGFTWMRENTPVCEVAGSGGPGRTWLISRHEDAVAAFTDPRLTSDRRKAVDEPSDERPRGMLSLDPPEHTRLRKLISRAFSPKAVAAAAPRVERIAERLIGEFAADGTADLVAQFAFPFPIAVIFDYIGVPAEHQVFTQHWSDLFIGAAFTGQDDDAARELDDYLRGLVGSVDRAADGLLPELVRALETGVIAEGELHEMIYVLLGAGHTTMVHLMADSILRMLESPARQARLAADPLCTPRFVDEVLRFDSPVQMSVRRFAAEDVSYSGHMIARGDTVIIAFAATNRDPRAFPDADRFDPDRGDNPHLSLGYGVHFCVGAQLARLEASAGLSALRRMLPGLALDAEPSTLPRYGGPMFRSPHSLPVRFTPEETSRE